MPRHDDLIFSSFDHDPADLKVGGSAPSTTEESARLQAIAQPDRHPNEIRDLFDLDQLDDERLEEWLAGDA